MNWYKVFYWITAADGIKNWMDILSNWGFALFILCGIGWLVCMILQTVAAVPTEDPRDAIPSSFYNAFLAVKKSLVKVLWAAIPFTILTWSAYVFIPTKKDALIIVAGGAVGNFITKDSSAKQIPSEVMTLLRDKIREEIKEINTPTVHEAADTLQALTKEQLIQIIKDKK